MAEAVAHAFDTGEHLAVQAGTGTGKSLAYLVPAIARAVASRRARGGVDRDHRAATPARRPRPAAAGRLARRRPAPPTGVRAAEGARKLPVPQQDSQRIRRPNRTTAAGGAVRAGRRHRAGPRRAAADRVVVDHRDRRPRRADARRAGPVVGAGQRVGAGMHRRRPLPVRHRLLRGEGPRQGRRRPTSSSPTTRCWPSTPSPTPPCCPSTSCSSSTRRTSWSTG